MAGRHLVVVLPGIGGSVLTRPGKPEEVVWDAGKGDIADLVIRPDRMSVAESPRLKPIGLTRSTKFLGFAVVPGYEGLLEQLESFGSIDCRGDPHRPRRDADVVAVPYDFRRGIVEAAERLDAVVRARLDDVDEAARGARVIVGKTGVARIMTKRRRKTLVVCQACHDGIHAGQPTATITE